MIILVHVPVSQAVELLHNLNAIEAILQDKTSALS